ncbi:hypothetical protein ACFL04_00725 [Patescibacteria group bacterium]
MARKISKKVRKVIVTQDKSDSIAPPTDKAQAEQFYSQQKSKNKSQFERAKKRKWSAKWIIISIVALVFIVSLLGFFVFQWGANQFTGDLVNISFEGSQNVSSGDTVTIKINYQNNESVPLGNASLVMQFPTGFTVRQTSMEPVNQAGNSWDIGNLSSGKSGSLTITGQLVGEIDSTHTFNAKLVYKPANFNATFETDDDFVVTITTSIINLELDGPTKIAPDIEAKYKLTYISTSESVLENIRISPQLPTAFELISSSPELNEEKSWTVERLTKSESGSFEITGKFTGDIGDTVELVFDVSIIDDEGFAQKQLTYTQLILLVGGDLSLSFKVNDSDVNNVVEHGDDLTYQLIYANNTEFVLENVSFSVEFDEAILAWDELIDSNGGNLDGKKINWNKDNISALTDLKPGAEGTIEFTIPIRTNLTIDTEKDINFSVVSMASGNVGGVKDGAGLTISVPTSTIESKIASNFNLSAEARYYTEEKEKLGAGPIPPQAGKKTTYRIIWLISNNSNDVRDVSVSAELPSDVKWAGEKELSAGNLTYNESKRTVTWTINEAPAGSGYYLSSLSASFEVSITPTTKDVGDIMLLTDVITAEGTDVYTQTTRKSTVSKLTTELTTDTFGQGKGVVVDGS